MVRAIDTQQVILQSGIAEKIQQTQQQNPDMQQRYFALDLSEKDKVLKGKINQAEETEKTFIKEKEEHGNGRKGKEQQRHIKETIVAGEDSDFEGEGENINIKV
ncbi:MAG: hypothetical protein ABFD50_03090 [Smithella sp.]